MNEEQLLARICIMYGLNLPIFENETLILNYFNTNSYKYDYSTILNAVESNLSGKTGRIIKPFNKEITIVFLAEILEAYKPTYENLKYEQLKNNLKLEPMKDDSKQKFIDETLTAWDNKTIDPKHFHYKTLVDNGRIKEITDTEFDLLKKVVENERKPFNPFEIVPQTPDAALKNRAIELYLKGLLKVDEPKKEVNEYLTKGKFN